MVATEALQCLLAQYNRWMNDKLYEAAGTLPPEDVAIDTHDQARAIAAVLDRLGVARARAVVGSSYGGMVALAFAAIIAQAKKALPA